MDNPYVEIYPSEQFNREYNNIEKLLFRNVSILTPWVPKSNGTLECIISKDDDPYKLFYNDNFGFIMAPLDDNYYIMDYYNLIVYYAKNEKIQLERLLIDDNSFSLKSHNISINNKGEINSINLDTKLIKNDIDDNEIKNILNKNKFDIFSYYYYMKKHLLHLDNPSIDKVQIISDYYCTKYSINDEGFNDIKSSSFLIDLSNDLLSNSTSKVLK